jgi:hypothetical protein
VIILLTATTLLALSWDGDGNPSTDNLPQTVLAPKTPTASDADNQARTSDDTTPAIGNRRRGRKPMLSFVVPRWRRLIAVIPPRGP